MLLRIISSTIGIISIAMSIYTLIRVYIQRKRTQNAVDNMDKIIAEIEEDKAKMVDLHRDHLELERLLDILASADDIEPIWVQIYTDMENYHNGRPLEYYKDEKELLHAIVFYYTHDNKEEEK